MAANEDSKRLYRVLVSRGVSRNFLRRTGTTTLEDRKWLWAQFQEDLETIEKRRRWKKCSQCNKYFYPIILDDYYYKRMLCSHVCFDRSGSTYYDDGDWRENYKAFYKTREWRELRYKIIEKHKGKCNACGRSAKDGVKIHVDHIVPRSIKRHLELVDTNLQLLCEDCNLGKSNNYETDWRYDERNSYHQ